MNNYDSELIEFCEIIEDETKLKEFITSNKIKTKRLRYIGSIAILMTVVFSIYTGNFILPVFSSLMLNIWIQKVQSELRLSLAIQHLKNK